MEEEVVEIIEDLERVGEIVKVDGKMELLNMGTDIWFDVVNVIGAMIVVSMEAEVEREEENEVLMAVGER